MTAPCTHPLTPLDNEVDVEQLFDRFWSESYPSAKAGPHARTTHIAFGEMIKQYMLNQSAKHDA